MTLISLPGWPSNSPNNTMPDLREPLKSALVNFVRTPLREAATGLLSELGYKSDRTINLENSNPKDFLDFIRINSTDISFNENKALFTDWKSADLLFQLTGEDLSGHQNLFKETSIDPKLLQSYLFFAIELTGDNYARGKLTGIVRQINRIFPMPVMLLIKHLADKRLVLSIAVINRRQSKRDVVKDVLGKVTIIRDISLEEPHRGHLDILASFAVPNLIHPQRLPIDSFDALHTTWEEIFNVDLLNKRFYRELANWYFWALPQVEFPADPEMDDEKRRATSLIRLLTRLIFCWFLKEKDLIPDRLFNVAELKKVLVDLDPDTCTYYQGILQNLFFATLNQRMGKDKKGKPFRAFARDDGARSKLTSKGVDTLYRYEEHFRYFDKALELFADIPFLNGGLFECLDRIEEGTDQKICIDGFSRDKEKRPRVPNKVFFSNEETADLSDAYGEPTRRNEKVRGLLLILHSYKFTIVENTPVDQEIALDPELLGQVFENLLASYNEETKTTARKQTGSFYTPRPIVEYIVDESLKAYLTGALMKEGMSELDAQVGLDILFAYTEREHPFHEREVVALLDAIHNCKILDPACGSGAFPMGMLQKLVYIIHKLDADNARWKQLQIDAAAKVPDPSARKAAIAAIERDFTDNENDYGRKLYLIENCLYGVDIQPIAIQISKLRFFISLVCDQRTNRSKRENHGIRPLPNLETQFVAADTLIGLPEMEQLALMPGRAYQIEEEIASLYHNHFAIQRRDQKLAIQQKIKELRAELGNLLAESLMASEKAQHVSDWDPFDQQASSDFFDPHWMFGPSLANGFDVIIQNPPYISHDKLSDKTKSAIRSFECWEPYADIYCYFVERAFSLLRNGGVSCSITSNSFLRADYGGPLRKYLANNSSVKKLLNIDKSQVFEMAIVNVAILIVSKNSEPIESDTFTAGNGTWPSRRFADYLESNTFFSPKTNLQRHIWSLSTEQEISIVREIEHRNLTLAKRRAKIRLGLATGSNAAFLVDKTQYDGFVSNDPLCSGVLKPVIRGRDVDRYAIKSAEQFLILSRNGVDIPRNYPVLAAHLESFGEEFKRRGAQGENWWNLRACSFYDDFESDRVVWIELTNEPRFAVCAAGVYMLNTAYFILPPKGFSAHTLVGILNSSVSGFYMKHSAQTSGMGVTRWFKVHVSEIPLPNLSQTQKSVIGNLVHLRVNSEPNTAQFLECLIDVCVMECYFGEHVAERDLLFIDDLEPLLSGFNHGTNDQKQRERLDQLFRALNAESSKIRTKLNRLTADSPELLAVILEGEGASRLEELKNSLNVQRL
jgi:adenine-specific DNA-methyltransferase